MKKVLAIFLSALLICISLMPAASAASLGVEILFTEGKYKEIALADSDKTISETTFTVAVRAPRGIKKLVGFNLFVEYDPEVLSVAEAGLAKDTKGNDNFKGILVSGQKANTNNQYAMAWIPNGNGVDKNTAKDLVYITFNVISTNKKQTSLNFYFDEFRTDDGKDNDVTSTILYESAVINFAYPDNTPPAETAPAEDGDEETSVINELLQMIRDMLNGKGVTFADFADAIANTLGNAEITDIIEQLVDGDVDISEGFLGILKDLGLDFGSFEDILNKIIDFIAGLFGGENGGDGTTAAGNNGGSVDTTADGSSSGSEKTGDAGVALAATVCVISSVAFVLTRKKKEIL